MWLVAGENARRSNRADGDGCDQQTVWFPERRDSLDATTPACIGCDTLTETIGPSSRASTTGHLGQIGESSPWRSGELHGRLM